ncbi:MAG TPA: methyltransferase, partial [Amycolatopsis sp.]
MSITREFFRHPLLTGAIAPSSPRLAEEMTAGLGLERAARVAELGPGTG